METLCAYCKTTFIPKRTDTRYCSHSCRQLAYVLRKALETNNQPLGELTDKTKPPINSEEGGKRLLMDKKSRQTSNESELTDKLQGPSKLTDLTIDDPSINDYDRDVKCSISVNTDQEVSIHRSLNLGQQNTTCANQPYIEWESPFIREIMEHSEQRNYASELCLLVQDPSAAWVSLHYKCLLECILCFSEMQVIKLEDLKEVCNAFTVIIHSRYYMHLPQNYPYTIEILEIRDNIKNSCSGEHELLKFRFKRKTKQKIITTRWELSRHIPKRNFNQLTFKE